MVLLLVSLWLGIGFVVVVTITAMEGLPDKFTQAVAVLLMWPIMVPVWLGYLIHNHRNKG